MSDALHPRPLTSGFALTALLLGLISLPALFAAPLLGLAAAAVALVCGIRGIADIARSRSGPAPRMRGTGAAIGGVVLSCLALLLGVVPALNGLVEGVIGGSRRMLAMDNFKQAVFAMSRITETQRGIMPAAIVDGDGKPLLSWRVAMLPFLEAHDLFREFHLDEPWDSPHNSKLIASMPAVFASPGSAPERGLTGMLVPVAPGTALADADTRRDFGHSQTASLLGVSTSAFEDGISTTAIIVSLPGVDVPWTKPQDLDSDPVAAFAEARRQGHAAVPVAFADGSVRSVPTDLAPESIRAMFSRAGGDAWSIPGFREPWF